MGMYDTFGRQGAQLKCGRCEFKHYLIGDEVPISDGAYLDYGAVVVIKGGRLRAVVNDLYDKWGGTLDIGCLLEDGSPVAAAVKDALGRTVT
ncbi:MAG TPA: hypothetical protein VM537_27105 [Anaerolineae bacterium]|nr:hypothetical protein [Anaerolineae bacterium]